MYAVRILDGRQKNKAYQTFKRFGLRWHSTIEQSPLTFRFTDWESAWLALKACKLYNMKARMIYQIA